MIELTWWDVESKSVTVAAEVSFSWDSDIDTQGVEGWVPQGATHLTDEAFDEIFEYFRSNPATDWRDVETHMNNFIKNHKEQSND